MKNDTLIRIEGMDALIEKLGLVEAERFIMLTKREPFDYTRWRENRFNDKSVETVFAEAAARRLAETAISRKDKAAPRRRDKAGKSNPSKRGKSKNPSPV